MNYKLIKEYPGSPPLGEEWDENTIVKSLTSNDLEEWESKQIKIKDLPEYWQPAEFNLPEKWYIDIRKRPIPKEIIEFFNKGNESNYYSNILNSFIGIRFNGKFDGAHLIGHEYDLKDYTEITFEQFKKYVLKEDEETVKDYEILSFKNPDNKIVYYNLKNDYCESSCSHKHSYDYCLKYYEIHSVKRLNDGEIFTIGDNVSVSEKIYPLKKIKFFNNETNLVLCAYEDDLNGFYNFDINCVRKNKKPLFTTEDGVDIYEGDDYWINNGWLNVLKKVGTKSLIFEPKLSDKAHSTKEKAEEYIIENKPCLSFNDVAKIFVSAKYTTKNGKLYPQGQKLKELVKQKIKQ